MQYQQQHSLQTLREGLEEYYSNYPDLDRFEPTDSRIIAQAFQAHDVIHVLTGMDISPLSEIILDTWQFWATLPGKNYWDSWRMTYIIFSDPEFSQRIKDIIFASSPWDWIKWAAICFIPACQAILNALTMAKKWHTYDFPKYLDSPLVDIRKEFNIKVL